MALWSNALKKRVIGQAGPSARGMLKRWGWFYVVRTVLGIAATAAYL
jgi:hypothetical protein